MPQSTSRWTAQASAVRKKDPVLYRLRTLSRTTTMGRRAIVMPHGTLAQGGDRAYTHFEADCYRGCRQSAEADRRVCRASQLRTCLGQCRAHGLASRLAGAGGAARLRWAYPRPAAAPVA